MLNLALGLLMFLTSAFLILIVLVQKGKGGGLTGALGGMGGESAFGSKAGDTFTRVTMGAAIFWILLCMFSIRMLNITEEDRFGARRTGVVPGVGAPADSSEGTDADADGADADGAATDGGAGSGAAGSTDAESEDG